MFNNASRPSRIWSFGAKAPTLCLDTVQEQMLLAHRYRNALVELEHSRRRRVEEKLKELFPHLLELEGRVAEMENTLASVRECVSRSNAAARKRSATPEQRAQVAEIRQFLKEARGARKAARKECFASAAWQDSQKEINAWANLQKKHLRKHSGLYWGSYLVVEQSMEGAKKGAPPEFRPWRGDGRTAVQLIRGLSVNKLLAGQDTRLRVIEDVGKHYCLLRVGSEGKRKEPIWAQVPIKLHREMPPDADVKWAYLQRKRIGRQEHWQVQLVLSRDSWDRDDWASEGEVGIDVGWRLLPEGLRVAYWVGSDGQEGELILPHRLLQYAARPRELASIRQSHFNAIMPILVQWLKGKQLPEWMEAQGVETLGHWRSTDRLARLVAVWEQNRIEGDTEVLPNAGELRSLMHLEDRHYGTPETLFEVLTAWRKKHDHLWNWEAHQRVKTVAKRKDIYRNFAAMLRRKYRTAFVEKLDVAQMRKNPEAEEEATPGAVKEHINIASVATLLTFLGESMREIVKLPPEYTTQRCHVCGELSGEAERGNLVHTCCECGASWDQDRNAALNLLQGDVSRVEAAAATECLDLRRGFEDPSQSETQVGA